MCANDTHLNPNAGHAIRLIGAVLSLTVYGTVVQLLAGLQFQYGFGCKQADIR